MGDEYIVLIADHEAKARESLRACMESEGYRAVTGDDGDKALRLIFELRPHVIIAEADLPHMARFGLCRAVRAELPTPIILISREPDQTDIVLGLELGADDYLAKPLYLPEVRARVHARLRRPGMSVFDKPTALPDLLEYSDGLSQLVAGELLIDICARTVTLGSREVNLTPKEFNLLVFLAANQGQTFSRDALLQFVWGWTPPYQRARGTVDTHISSLRTKLKQPPGDPELLQTASSMGYTFNEILRVRRIARPTPDRGTRP